MAIFETPVARSRRAESALLTAEPRPGDDALGLIHELGRMQEASDLPDLFASLARSVVFALRADACLVSMLDEDRGILRDVAAHVVPPAVINTFAEEFVLSDYPTTAAAVADGGVLEVSVSDPGADPAEVQLLEQIGFGRLLLCRLMVDGTAVGTVEAYLTEDTAFPFDAPERIELLSTFAAGAYSRIRLTAKLEQHYTTTIEALASALDAKDPYTRAHTGRIRDLAMALSAAMKLPSDVRRAVRLGAILHDVGKIGISDAILLKPGPLTSEEWGVMRRHPEIGEQMLRGVEFCAPALPIIRHHHERWDGAGYPDRLIAEAIPIGARVVAVCDSFDAMTSDRPYRKGMPATEACAELLAGAGTQFDPVCAELLVEMVSNLGDRGLEERLVRFA